MIEGTTKKEPKKDVPLYYIPKSFVSEVVSTRRIKTIGEEKVGKVTTRRQQKKGKYEREVYQKQKTFKPYMHFS